MPENKNSKPSRMTDPGKKKKKRKKVPSSTPAPENKDKSLAVSLPPESSLVSFLPQNDLGQTTGKFPKANSTGKKNRDQSASSGHKGKKHPKESQTLLTVTRKTGVSKDCASMTKLSIQAKESLRWEGELHDPQEEAKRLEQYRANRRQRYIAHREALLKDTLKTDISSREQAKNDYECL